MVRELQTCLNIEYYLCWGGFKELPAYSANQVVHTVGYLLSPAPSPGNRAGMNACLYALCQPLIKQKVKTISIKRALMLKTAVWNKFVPTFSLIMRHHNTESFTAACKMGCLFSEVIKMFQYIGTVYHIVLVLNLFNVFIEKIDYIAILGLTTTNGYIGDICCKYFGLRITESQK